jgi:hypothetical protein
MRIELKRPAAVGPDHFIDPVAELKPPIFDGHDRIGEKAEPAVDIPDIRHS